MAILCFLTLGGDDVGPEGLDAGTHMPHVPGDGFGMALSIQHDLPDGAAWDTFGTFYRDTTVQTARAADAFMSKTIAVVLTGDGDLNRIQQKMDHHNMACDGVREHRPQRCTPPRDAQRRSDQGWNPLHQNCPDASPQSSVPGCKRSGYGRDCKAEKMQANLRPLLALLDLTTGVADPFPPQEYVQWRR